MKSKGIFKANNVLILNGATRINGNTDLILNLDIELVDSYFFGNINEKGEIGSNSEYLRQVEYLGKNLIEYFNRT